jgi:Leucine-rich repeat (LRR) protein
MVQCHIKELMDNFCEFQDDDTTQTAIENSMPPDIPARSQLAEMNENIIRSICKEVELENITYLNLFNNKIKRISGLDSLVNLKTLILSFNELEDMDGI